MEYFKKLLELLKIERAEDQRTYLELTQRLSVQDRRANGLSWYPVAIRGTEMSRGDYLTVELERTTHQEIIHQFRFGASVQLFSNHDAKNSKIEGTISYQGQHKMKITLRTDELPEWSRDGKLGVDLLFDDNSYDEMEGALKQAMLQSDRKDAKLIKVLADNQKPGFEKWSHHFVINGLNDSQNEAIQKILEAEDLAIVHGPPGTGKTTTLVQAIRVLIKERNEKVLVVAPSNTAVDLISEKLSEQGLIVVRVGNPVRVSDRLISLTLDQKTSEHPSSKEIKKLKRQAAEFKDMAHKYKRNFGKAERDQRKALFDEAKNIMRSVEQTEKYIVEDILSKAQVITATLVGANHYSVKHLSYGSVFIDEAGQSLEPACWIPISKARKLILAGDHCQLPPTVKSEQAAKAGLSETVLERMVKKYPEAVVLLDQQYRMNEKIMQYSSDHFYNGRLQADSSVAHHSLFDGDDTFLFIDTAGCGFEEKQIGTGTTNPEEAAFLFKHLERLTSLLFESNYSNGNFPSVAIIAPYKLQVDLLKDLLEQNPSLSGIKSRIAVNTIDGFQGQEKDIVLISLTRSNPDNRIGFLSEIRRMNVAMTRARKKLVIIGDSATLSKSGFYSGLIQYAEKVQGYKSAWEYMD